MNNNDNQMNMNMNMINNPFNMMNNQFNMNNMMMNQMNQMNNMENQINVIENQKLLSIKARMEKGGELFVQCKSNDKMKRVIENFCIKACIQKKEDYDFIIIKEEKVKLDSSVEQNGINQKGYILAKKIIN